MASAPNPNAGLNSFVVSDLVTSGKIFDAASWSNVAQANASWNSASWASASWNSASWNSASWASASWNSASWASASWNSASWNSASWSDASWNSASWSDNAEVEAPSAEGEYLTDAELAEFAAELGLANTSTPIDPVDLSAPPLP